MNLELDRDICFFDIEATGLNVVRDRIIQIAAIKYFKKDKEPSEISLTLNPGVPISEEAMAVHGIRVEDVRNKPTFAQVAQKLYDFFGSADLAGYNVRRLDIPMLMEEFDRVGMEFNIENRRIIDVQRIFYRMEPRNLKAAYKFYCKKEMNDAHDALVDVRATMEVLDGQLNKYKGVDLQLDDEILEAPVNNNVDHLHQFTDDLKIIDVTKKLKYNHQGEIVFNFGKYLGQPVVETLTRDKNYYNWILNKEFSVQVKKIVKKLMAEYHQNKHA